MKLRYLSIAIIVFVFFGISPTIAQVTTQVIMINQNSPCSSGCDGSSWAKAYRDLAPVLTANRYINNIRFIYWIAAGTYKPTSTTNRSMTFAVGPNTEIYGGFAGYESNINDRQFAGNTFLSGDIGTPQTFSAYTANTSNIPAVDSNMTDPGLQDNSYNVVTLVKTGSNSILNHVVITGGCAYGLQGTQQNTDTLISHKLNLTDTNSVNNNLWMGGGIYARGAINHNITDCIIAGNYARGYGGGLATDSSKINFANCNIEGNFSRNGGGGVFEINAATYMLNCVVKNNVSQLNGGGYMTVTSPTMEGAVDGDIANFSPAEMSQKLANALFLAAYKKLDNDLNAESSTVENVLLALNIGANGLNLIASRTNSPGFQHFAQTWVNGMDNWGSPEALAQKLAIEIASALDPDPARNVRLAKMRAEQSMYGTRYSTVMTSCLFQGNYAKIGGGGFFCTHSNFIFDGVEFSGNTAGMMAGAIFNEAFNSPILKSCLFHHNSATSFGTMVNSMCTAPQILNCTFTQNSTTGPNGAALANLMRTDAKIANCIFWGNTSSTKTSGGADIFTPTTADLAAPIKAIIGNGTSDHTGVSNIFSSIIQQLPDITPGVPDIVPGCAPFVDPRCIEQEFGALNLGAGNMIRTGNMSADPLLDGSYKPTAHSLAIDGGNNYYTNYSNLPITLLADLAGNTRVQGSKVDLGCYEYGGAATPNTSTIIYVNQAAAPGGDGTSWAKAYNDLQYALYSIQYSSIGTYKQVWVAKGIYRPTTTSDRTKTFRMPLEQVAYYGGFNGTETNVNQRIIASNPTILSGNIGDQNDSTDNSYHVIKTDIVSNTLYRCTIDGFTISNGTANGTAENSYGGAVYIPNTTYALEFNNCTFSNNSAENYGGAIYAENYYGLTNCLLINNKSKLYGGAIYNALTNNAFVPSKCTFTNNSAVIGGAIFHAGSSSEMDHCSFNNNTAVNMGGGLYINSTHQYALMKITESLFANNTLTGTGLSQGAGMYANGLGGLYVIQSTFTQNNIASSNGAGAALYSNMSQSSLLTGSIVWNNNINGSPNFLPYGKTQVSSEDNIQITYTCFQNYEIDPTLQPQPYSVGMLLQDPGFVSPTTSNFHLSACSRAIDKGDNTRSDTTDLDGSIRLQGNRVDMGAYEFVGTPIPPNNLTATVDNDNTCEGGSFVFHATGTLGVYGDSIRWQVNTNDGKGYHNVYDGGIYSGTRGTQLTISNAPLAIDGYRYRIILYGSCVSISNEQQVYVYGPIIYVDSSAAFNGYGNSWSNPFKYLSDAQDAALNRNCAQLWVAKGTYYPSTTNSRGDKLFLKSNVSMYGGFAGNETALSQRNWTANPTIISGDLGVLGDASDNSARIFYALGSYMPADSTAVLDGFTIRDANGSTGSAISIEGGASPTIRNCTFISNYSTDNGGAINADGDKMRFENCTFNFNTGGGNGGAIRSTKDIALNNCRFNGNNSGGSGGAVYLVDASATITNCTFTNNTSSANGGAIRMEVTSIGKSLIMGNCIIKGNSSSIDGGGLSLVQSVQMDSTKLRNVDFLANSGREGGGMHTDYPNYQSYMYFFNCTFKGNVARQRGGGLMAAHDIRLLNCIISGNKSYTYGGGIYFAGSNNASGQLINCDVVGNYAKGGVGSNQTPNNAGGGMYDNSSTGVLISNTIMYYNLTGSTAPYNSNIYAQSYGNIMSQYIPALSQTNYWVNSSGPTDVQGVTEQSGNDYNCDPQFVKTPDPFIDSTGGDLHLLACSPLLNVGNTYFLTTSLQGGVVNDIAKDLDGNPRIYNNGIVDLGPYENQGTAPVPAPAITLKSNDLVYCEKNTNQLTIQGVGNGLQFQWYQMLSTGALIQLVDNNNYNGTNTNSLTLSQLDYNNNGNKYVVKMSCSDGCVLYDTSTITVYPNRLYVNGRSNNTVQDGKTWGTAYSNIYDAFKNKTVQCSTEIWVAQGTYTVSSSASFNNDSTLHLRAGLAVYGGFNGTETSLTQRNYTTQPCIITANRGGNRYTDVLVFSYNFGDVTDATAILDGFYLSDASCALMNFYNDGPTIRNCTFQNNTSSDGPSAIRNVASAMQVYNCSFYNNYSGNAIGNAGGTFTNQLGDSTTRVLVKNCKFKGNSSASVGSAINSGGPINIIGCEVTGNKSSYSGAIVLNGKSNVINTTIAGNYSGASPGGITAGSGVSLINNIIYNNNSSSGRNYTSQIYEGSCTISNCNIEFMTNTGGANQNRYVDPLFVSNGRTMQVGDPANAGGDYHLLPCSPMINTGDNSMASVSGTDLDSNNRIYANKVDLGAYEYSLPGNTTVALTINDTALAGNVCESLPTGIPLHATVTGNNVSYQWQSYNYNTHTYQNVSPMYVGAQTDSLQIPMAQYSIDDQYFRTAITTPGCPVYYTQPTKLIVHSKGNISISQLNAMNCLNQPPLQFYVNIDFGALVNVGTATGDGVTPDFKFDAAAAGVGPHLIKYYYTSTYGCSDSLFTPVYVLPLPEPHITIPTGINHFCLFDSLKLDVDPFYSRYLWSDNNTNASRYVDQTRMWVVTVTDGNGCQGSDSIQTYLDFIDHPAEVSPSQADGCMGIGIRLTANYGSGLTWYYQGMPMPDTTQSIMGMKSGFYSVKYTTQGGCSTISSPSSIYLIDTPATNIIVHDSTELCGGSVQLEADVTGGSYQWSTNQTSQFITVSQAKTVTLTSSNGSCLGHASVTITNHTFDPGLWAINPRVCSDGTDSILLISIAATQTNDTYTFDWYKDNHLIIPNGPSQLTRFESGRYSLHTTSASGCQGNSQYIDGFVDTITSDIYPASDTLCPGERLMLSNPSATIYYYGSQEINRYVRYIVPTDTGWYHLDLDDGTCHKVFDKHIAYFRQVSITSTGQMCTDGFQTLTAHTDNDPARLLWSTGDTTATIRVTQGGTYSVTATYTVSSCAVVSSFQINSNLEAEVTIATNQNPVCAGSPTTFTATPVQGGIAPTYQWLVNGVAVGTDTTIFTRVMDNGDKVSCVLTISEPCAARKKDTSNVITMMVNPIDTPSVTIRALQNPVCPNTPVDFEATYTGGGSSPSILWFMDGFGTAYGPTFSVPNPYDGQQIFCTLDNWDACASVHFTLSNTVTINVGLHPAITITTPQTVICPGAAATFTATATDTGATPSYTWYVNGSVEQAGGLTYTNTTLADGDEVTCALNSSDPCAPIGAVLSNIITVTYNHNIVVPTIMITASRDTVCEGDSITFTAATTNGGPTPIYDWYVQGVLAASHSSTFTTNAIANRDEIYCRMTSSLACALPQRVNSNYKMIFVNRRFTPSISISVSDTTVCQGSSATFYASVFVITGTQLHYQWRKNGMDDGSDQSSYTPATINDGDVITCKLSISGACATADSVVSNSINMSVSNGLPSTVTITTPTTSVQSGHSVTFTAAIINGGPSPSIEWYVNSLSTGVMGTDTYTTNNLQFGDVVSCKVLPNGQCSNTSGYIYSNDIFMYVSANTILPDITIGTYNSGTCLGKNQFYFAIIHNGGNTPHYKWMLNGVQVGNDTDVLNITSLTSTTDVVNCELTSSDYNASPVVVMSNNVNIIVYAPPVVSLGNDTAICLGTSLVLDAGNAGSTYLWSDNSTSQTLAVTQSGANSVTVTNTHGCSSSDTVVVGINTLPVVSLGNDTAICSGASLTLDASNAGSTYHWNDNSTSQTLTAEQSAAYSITVTNGNGCSSSDTIVVGINALPLVSLGNDTAICSGAALTLDAGNMGSTYLWSDNSTSQTLTATQASTYSVTVTNTTGCSASDTIVVGINALPVISLGNDTAICTGNSLALNAGNTGSTYLWSDNSTSQTLTVTQGGTYSVTVTNTTGCSASDTIVVGTNALPVISLGNDTAICFGASLVLNAGNTGSTYLWSDNSTSQILTATQLGTYGVTVINASGCSSSDTIVVGINALPLVSLGNDTAICSGAALTLDAGNMGSTYLWSDNSTLPMLTSTQSGTYSVTVTNTHGCSSSDTVIVGINALPVVTLGNDTAICLGTSLVLDAGNAGSTYLWSENSTSQTLAVTQSGASSVTVTNSSGCTSSDTIVVGINALPVVSLGNDTAICSGASLTLDASNAGSTYLWSDNSTSQTLAVTQSGANSVTVTNTHGCSSSDTIVVGINALPVVSLGNDTAICSGAALTLDAGNMGSTYLWSDNSTSQTLTATQASTYSVTVTNTTGCSASDTIVVDINALPVVSLGNDTAICSGASLTLDASNAGSTYHWNDNSTSHTLIATQAGTYSVTVSNASGCSSSDKVMVDINALPVISLGNDTAICTGNSLALNAGNTGSTYLWSNNSTSQILTATQAAIYSVTVINASGCSSSDTIVVGINALPIVSLGNDTAICSSSRLALNAGNVGSTYLWSDNSTSQILTATQLGTYGVTVINASGCSSSDTIVVGINALPVISLGNDTAICLGASLTLDASNAGSTYLWSDNSTSQTLTATQASTYSVTVTNTTGCSASDTIVVGINALPVVSLGNDTAICSSSRLALNAGNVGSIYLWSDNSTSQTLTVTQAGTYSVTVTNFNGCSANNSININFIPSVIPTIAISANPSGNICLGASVTFTTATINGGNSPVYQWYINGNRANGNATLVTTSLRNGDSVSVVLYSNAICSTPSTAVSNIMVAAIDSAVTPLVSVTASPSGAICAGTEVSFTATGINGGAPVFQWFVNNVFTATGSIYSNSGLQNGTEVKTVMTSTMACAVRPTDTSGIYTAVVFAPFTPSIQLVDDTLVASGAVQYQWYNNSTAILGATDSRYHPTESGQYTVEATDRNGCSATSLPIDVLITGIENIVSGEWAVYPNPTTGIVCLTFEKIDENEPLFIHVYDVGGREIVTNTILKPHIGMTVKSDLRAFAQGIYFLRVANGGSVLNKRIVLNR